MFDMKGKSIFATGNVLSFLSRVEFKFPLAFASKRKRLDGFAGLPKFRWEDLVGQEVMVKRTLELCF